MQVSYYNHLLDLSDTFGNNILFETCFMGQENYLNLRKKIWVQKGYCCQQLSIWFIAHLSLFILARIVTQFIRCPGNVVDFYQI